MNEQTNTSAYASAESSPNSSLTPSSSSFQANLENLNINHIANEENHRKLMNELMINHSKSSLPISHSSNSLEKFGSNGNNHPLSSEFQSLPPAQSTQSLNEKKDDVKTIIGNVVKTSLSDLPKTTQQSPTKTQTSPGKSAVMSFLGKMLNKKPAVTSTTTTSTTTTSTNGNDNNSSMKSSNSSLSVASSSSPNPDCSPYKLLASEIPTQQNLASPNQLTSTNKLGTLSPNGTTINDAVAIFKAASSSTTSNTTENIEKLASLNHKEHEKADPILSTNNLTKDTSSNSKLNDLTNKTEQLNAKKQDEGDVPSSSREFCNDLNFNLALNAAATSVGPVVVVDTSKNNERFTSNASTSSIHNDLKLILEQNKTKKTEQQNQHQHQPKPQRQHKSKHNDSLNSSTSSSVSDSKKVDLVKLISMVSQKKKSYKDILIEMNINDGVKYRYTKDFLKQIKHERVNLIENICYPDIFRTFCGCVNGKQWDPERYFDMIQYPDNIHGEKQKMNYHNNNKSNRKYNNSHQKGMLSMDSSAVESPQPLQVPKNSPKSAQSIKTSKKSNKKEENPDNILLNLLKKNAQPKQNNNILDLLNNKQTTPVAKSPSKKIAKTNNLLDDLFKKSQPVQQQQQQTQPKHFPQVLTVQELEMTQFVSNNNNK